MRGQPDHQHQGHATWGFQCQGLRDKEVSYHGARRTHLSRRSQEAWFTLGCNRTLGGCTLPEPSVAALPPTRISPSQMQ